MLTSVSPLEHFRSLIEEALREQRLRIDKTVEFYLANLLARYVDTRKFSTEPVALRLLKALDERRELKNLLLKEVGDTTLFVAGFFHESLKRKLVDVDYYIDIGTISYNHLADSLSAGTSSQLSSLYRELSERFVELVDVLGEVSERTRLSSINDILRIYERWLRTGSKRMERLLRDMGIEPTPVSKDSLQ